jgi:hypothetical protein
MKKKKKEKQRGRKRQKNNPSQYYPYNNSPMERLVMRDYLSEFPSGRY